jgi:hypothetical protein
MPDERESLAIRRCDRPGCTAEGCHRTVMGKVLCEHCNDVLVMAETGCLSGNGTPAPPSGWWRRLRRHAA